jgi:disulfide bond formation protein DsbB
VPITLFYLVYHMLLLGLICIISFNTRSTLLKGFIAVLVSLSLSLSLSLCIHTYHSMHMGVKGQLVEVGSLHHVGPED